MILVHVVHQHHLRPRLVVALLAENFRCKVNVHVRLKRVFYVGGVVTLITQEPFLPVQQVLRVLGLHVLLQVHREESLEVTVLTLDAFALVTGLDVVFQVDLDKGIYSCFFNFQSMLRK